MKKLLLICALALSSSAFAQSTPVGRWHTVDDKTGEVKSLIVIGEEGGALTGRITALLRKSADQNAVCDKCKDERKGRRMIGLDIIRGAKQVKEHWEGEILDPESGKTYDLKMVPIEGGAKLQVRGYLGPFYRTQVWVRVQ